MEVTEDLVGIYRHRFSLSEREQMDSVWSVLTRYFFNRWVNPNDSVLDLGAGSCAFINHISANEKTAIDANPAVEKACTSGVHFIQSDDFSKLSLENRFDKIFVSNFLEHLESGAEVVRVLRTIRNWLKPGGKILVLQPNFALVGAKYFDFIDHKTILTDKSLTEALEVAGFKVEYLKKRFLPYTSKSVLPKNLFFVWLYLKIPLLHYFFGEQTFVVASPSGGSVQSPAFSRAPYF